MSTDANQVIIPPAAAAAMMHHTLTVHQPSLTLVSDALTVKPFSEDRAEWRLFCSSDVNKKEYGALLPSDWRVLILSRKIKYRLTNTSVL